MADMINVYLYGKKYQKPPVLLSMQEEQRQRTM